MFDFLFDNPYLLFLILYAVYRFLRGGSKEKGEAAKERLSQKAVSSSAPEPGEAAALAKAPLPRAPAAASLEERLRQFAIEWEKRLSGGPATPRKDAPAAVAAPAAPGVAAGGPSVVEPFTEPMVSESLASEQVLELDGETRTHSVFDFRAARPEPAMVAAAEARGSAFAFREPTRLAATAFAQGPSTVSSASAAGSGTGESRPGDSKEVEPLLGSPEEIYRAVVLSEILARPRALRPWGRRAGAF